MYDNPFAPRIPLLPSGEGPGMRAEHCHPFLQCSVKNSVAVKSPTSCPCSSTEFFRIGLAPFSEGFAQFLRFLAVEVEPQQQVVRHARQARYSPVARGEPRL